MNLKRILELDAEGLLMDAGRHIWQERNLKNQNRYSFEQESHGLSAVFEAMFQKHPVAWENFNRMAPSYRKPAMWYVMSAKQ